jgi:hypothetical protein
MDNGGKLPIRRRETKLNMQYAVKTDVHLHYLSIRSYPTRNQLHRHYKHKSVVDFEEISVGYKNHKKYINTIFRHDAMPLKATGL